MSAFSKESFPILEAQCELRCEAEASSTIVTRTGIYSPPDRGLERGNGGMWAPLTLDLWEFGLELCSGVQTKLCEDGQRASRHLKEIKSGQWSMPEPSCNATTRILSPMDADSGASVVPQSTWAPSSKSAPRLDLKIALDEKGKNCLLPVDLKFCGGDCVDLDDCKQPQTLCTPKPSIKSSDRYCVKEFSADTLNQLKKLDSLDKEWACRSLLRSSFEKDNPKIGRCAAIRFDSPCQEWLGRIDAHLSQGAKPESASKNTDQERTKKGQSVVPEKPACCQSSSHESSSR